MIGLIPESMKVIIQKPLNMEKEQRPAPFCSSVKDTIGLHLFRCLEVNVPPPDLTAAWEHMHKINLIKKLI